MNASESLTELHKAVLAARPKFRPIVKANTATIGAGREYQYADLAALLDAVTPALTEHGLIVVQPIDPETSTLITRLMHVSGEWIESRYPLHFDLSPQQIGSALTYGRRYSLLALLCLAAEDDDGATATETPRANARKSPGAKREPTPASDRAPTERVVGKVSAVSRRPIGSGGKEKFIIKLQGDGRAFESWSNTIAVSAKDAQTDAREIEIVFRPGKFGLEILTLNNPNAPEPPL